MSKKSFIWDYLSVDPKDDKKAVCGTYSELISRGGTIAKNFNTSHLRYHLQRVHIDKFKELELKQEEADKKAEEYEVKQQKTDLRQLTLAEVKECKDLWSYGHPQHKKVMGWITEMITIDSQPFSIVEDTGFLRLLSNVCPLYAVPSWKYFAEKIIPEMFSTIKEQLMKDIHPDEEDSFPESFTTDIWTRDAGGDSFISWTAHYIDPITFTREECVLQVCPFAGSHTAIAISEMITKFLDSWKVPKTRMHIVVRDNAASMVAGVEQCGLPSISCVIHALQLVIKYCILAQCSVSDMLARCRKIVGHYKHSHLAVERLQDIQCQLGLPNHKFMQDKPT